MKQLRVMHVRKLLDGLDLENDFAADNEIQALLTNQLTSVCHGVRFLPLEWNCSRSKLNGCRPRVHHLAHSRTNLLVHRDAAADSVVYQLLDFF